MKRRKRKGGEGEGGEGEGGEGEGGEGEGGKGKGGKEEGGEETFRPVHYHTTVDGPCMHQILQSDWSH